MRPSLLTQSDRQPYTYPRSPCEQTWHLAAKIRDAHSPASRFPCLFPSTRRRDSKPTSRRYAALPAHGSASTPAPRARRQTWESLQQQQRVGICRIIPPGDRTPAPGARVREPAARRQAAVARSIALPTTSTAPGGALPRRRCTRLRLTPSSARPTLTARLPRRAAWERRPRLGDTHGNARRTAGGGARWAVMATDAHGPSCNQSVRQV